MARRKLSHKDTLSVIRLVGVQASSNVIVEDRRDAISTHRTSHIITGGHEASVFLFLRHGAVAC